MGDAAFVVGLAQETVRAMHRYDHQVEHLRWRLVQNPEPFQIELLAVLRLGGMIHVDQGHIVPERQVLPPDFVPAMGQVEDKDLQVQPFFILRTRERPDTH